MVARNIVRLLRIKLLFVWILLLCAGLLYARTTNKAGENQAYCIVPKDEIAVLAVFYDRPYEDITVLVTETEQWPFADAVNLELAVQGHGLPPDLRNDFDGKNRSSCTIRPFVEFRNLHFISSD